MMAIHTQQEKLSSVSFKQKAGSTVKLSGDIEDVHILRDFITIHFYNSFVAGYYCQSLTMS